ncbi:MAG: hypothetical protein ACOC3V_03575 [bacterium]
MILYSKVIKLGETTTDTAYDIIYQYMKKHKIGYYYGQKCINSFYMIFRYSEHTFIEINSNKNECIFYSINKYKNEEEEFKKLIDLIEHNPIIFV